ncbi:hypothetical protein IMSAGC019_00716 [Lachnospiraceae bacterium]|nr:hypothetical protein IMSAGC019_00716 [Lachnospiraceae bacterium]
MQIAVWTHHSSRRPMLLGFSPVRGGRKKFNVNFIVKTGVFLYN